MLLHILPPPTSFSWAENKAHFWVWAIVRKSTKRHHLTRLFRRQHKLAQCHLRLNSNCFCSNERMCAILVLEKNGQEGRGEIITQLQIEKCQADPGLLHNHTRVQHTTQALSSRRRQSPRPDLQAMLFWQLFYWRFWDSGFACSVDTREYGQIFASCHRDSTVTLSKSWWRSFSLVINSSSLSF